MGKTGEIPRVSDPSSPPRSRGSSSRIWVSRQSRHSEKTSGSTPHSPRSMNSSGTDPSSAATSPPESPTSVPGAMRSRRSVRAAEDEQEASSSSQPMPQHNLEALAAADIANNDTSRSGHLSRYLPGRHISIDKGDFTRSTNGYVETMTGSLVSATALISPNLEINIISIREAHRLDLVVHAADAKRDPTWLDSGTGSGQRSIGWLDLIWRKSNDMTSPPLSLRCEVHEHSQSIVLGRPYAQAKEKVWGKRKA